ncbi:hypothetical protein K2173_027762 [Erythroxylum novogranatense]|uniref:Uncharacterized protein n=1 Tax=Erythroxylum novogranatense TaxID=1862640 RepID=A0AAV8U040_9ROSI|nr:hypothetical protein K2173_027762 [Erythroxylum novogranatense]
MASVGPEGQPPKKGPTRKHEDEIPTPKPTYSEAIASPSSMVAHALVLLWMDNEPIAMEDGDITSEKRPEGSCPSCTRSGGPLRTLPFVHPGGSCSHVSHRAGMRGAATVRSGSHFNVLENVEAQTEEVTPNVTNPIPTAGATSNSTAQPKGPEVSLTRPTRVDRALGSRKQAPEPDLVQLQPTTTDKHLTLEIQLHTEMICDQLLFLVQPSSDAEPSHLMERVEAFGIGDSPGVIVLCLPQLNPRSPPPGRFIDPDFGRGDGSTPQEVENREAQDGGPLDVEISDNGPKDP